MQQFYIFADNLKMFGEEKILFVEKKWQISGLAWAGNEDWGQK